MKMEDRIREKINTALKPEMLLVVNESHLHAGHAGDDGSGESHFRVELASHNLKGSSRVAQQREIFDVLSEEMPLIHALSIKINKI